MPEPTFEIFGAGTQKISAGVAAPGNGLFIPELALNLEAGKGAESYLAAIILIAKSQLTEAGFASNLDQSITVTSGFPTFTYRGTENTAYRIDQLTVNLAKLDSGSNINPNDYS